MKKIVFLLICMIITTLLLSNTTIGQNQYYNDKFIESYQTTKFDFLYSNNLFIVLLNGINSVLLVL